ncbi:hypothetical protein D3C78_1639600 [compost metagenome]
MRQATGGDVLEQGQLQANVCAGRVLGGQIGQGAPIVAHGPLHHDQIPEADVRLQGAGRADPHQNAGTGLYQLLQRYDGGGTADAGAADGDGQAQMAAVDQAKLPALAE